ncbi:MAG: hypothetical protein JNN07_10815 [Verrucomicrobiales bacterium]|nr:hypothetical protein [Verrucomicrobiales bacterium]
MNDLLNTVMILAFIGGLAGIVALWVQHTLSRQREAKEPNPATTPKRT